MYKNLSTVKMKDARKSMLQKARSMTIVFGVLLLCAGLLTGCQDRKVATKIKNLEERDYATVLLVCDGNENAAYHMVLGIAKEERVGEKSMNEAVCKFECDNLEDLFAQYASVKGKELSLSHIKVMLLADTIKQWNPLISQLEKNDGIAKTCPVLLLKDCEGFTQYLEDAKEPVGRYLEGLIRQKNIRGKRVSWLKDYIKVQYGDGVAAHDYLVKQPEGFCVRVDE